MDKMEVTIKDGKLIIEIDPGDAWNLHRSLDLLCQNAERERRTINDDDYRAFAGELMEWAKQLQYKMEKEMPGAFSL